MACLFCGIAERALPANIVAEGPTWMAFLDRSPVFLGHVLVVPKAHHEILVDLPAELLAPLFGAVQAVSRAVTSGLGAEGTFVAMNNRVSQSVAHLHVHVIPRTKGDGLKGFFWPRKKYDDAAHMERVSETLRGAFAADGTP